MLRRLRAQLLKLVLDLLIIDQRQVHGYLRCSIQDYYVYCKSFKVEKFLGFHGSIGKHETFTVKHFHLVLKMAGQGLL